MPMSGANLRISGERLWDSLMEMAQVGPGIAGGNNRQTLTDADAEGRRLFQRWCEAAGCTMGLDTMGNMFARREGDDPSLDPIYMGSHLDTQPTGGKYDGVLGVLGGLEVLRTLADAGIRTIRIAAREVLDDLDAVARLILAEVRSRFPLHHPAALGGPPPRDELGEE